jgi:hypothetical protein
LATIKAVEAWAKKFSCKNDIKIDKILEIIPAIL